jgi:hypothetical protein
LTQARAVFTFAIYILLPGQLQPHFQVLMGLGWDDVRLPNPVRPGDELDLEMTVLEIRESKSRSDRGIIRNRNLLRNQKRETVLERISNIFVARRSDANAPTPDWNVLFGPKPQHTPNLKTAAATLAKRLNKGRQLPAEVVEGRASPRGTAVRRPRFGH